MDQAFPKGRLSVREKMGRAQSLPIGRPVTIVIAMLILPALVVFLAIWGSQSRQAEQDRYVAHMQPAPRRHVSAAPDYLHQR